MNITRSEVENYLADVRTAVKEERYQVSSRDKNRELFIDYVFTEDKRKEVWNDHPQHPEEILYIFGKDILLMPRFGKEEEKISLYIKFNKWSNSYLIVISFHKQEYPLKYKFK